MLRRSCLCLRLAREAEGGFSVLTLFRAHVISFTPRHPFNDWPQPLPFRLEGVQPLSQPRDVVQPLVVGVAEYPAFVHQSFILAFQAVEIGDDARHGTGLGGGWLI